MPYPRRETRRSASVRALEHLRDFSTLKWYVIPLLAIVPCIYAVGMRKARARGNWDAVLMNVIGMGILGWRY